jgi:hypothetical protein
MSRFLEKKDGQSTVRSSIFSAISIHDVFPRGFRSPTCPWFPFSITKFSTDHDCFLFISFKNSFKVSVDIRTTLLFSPYFPRCLRSLKKKVKFFHFTSLSILLSTKISTFYFFAALSPIMIQFRFMLFNGTLFDISSFRFIVYGVEVKAF